MTLRGLVVFLWVAGGAWASVPPSTGQGGGSTDPNYHLSPGTAFIVTNQPASWGNQPGAQWIGPAADAVHNHPPGTSGNFAFTLTFKVVDITKASLTLSVMADPDVNIVLNGNSPDVLDADTGQIVGSPKKVTLSSQNGLVQGSNTLIFLVSDFGAGPVGLNVTFTGTLGDTSSSTGQCMDLAGNVVNLVPLTVGSGTGTNLSIDRLLDASFCITSNTITDPLDALKTPALASLVNPVADGWSLALNGTYWIAPGQDQSNADVPNNCCAGTTTYTAILSVPDPTVVDPYVDFLVDDSVSVTLNGKNVTSSDGSFTGSTSRELGAFNGLIAGNNVLVFTVTNVSGPTGLDVIIYDANAPLPTPPDTPPSPPADSGTTASPDPVDSATGQFYESITDLKLGGMLPLNFTRYYSSQLPSVTSSLGPNWMSNFDLRLSISATTAKILLFRGKQVVFNKSGSSWQLVSPLNVVYQFAQNGLNYQLMNPITKLVYTFSPAGALMKVEDRNGNALTITPASNGPASVADGAGRTLTFTYTGKLLTKVTDQAGRTVTYGYTGGNLASYTDAAGNTTKYSYTSSGKLTILLTQKIWPLGNSPSTQVYDGQGRVTSQIDANGKTLKIGYDGKGGTTVTDPLANVTHQASDVTGDLKQLSDPDGGTAALAYNSANQRTGVTDKVGNTTSFTYHSQTGLLTSQVYPQGGAINYTYGAQPQGVFTFYVLTGVNYPDGTSATMTYDGRGNLLTATDANGKTVARTYDTNGRVTKITDANGQTSTYSYNSDGTMASVTDPLGNTIAYTYDAAKNVASMVAPNGGTTAYLYDADGRLISVTDPVKATATTHLDANGQRDSWTNPAGGAWKFTHDANLKITSMTDAQGNKTSYSYNDNGHLASITNGAGQKISYTFDGANHVAAVADNLGTRWSYAYTSEGQLASRTDATGRKTTYSYDPLGHPSGFISPGGNQYTTTHDKMGRVTSHTNPLGETISYTYDSLGRLTQINRPGSISTSIGRDAAGRPISVTSPNGDAWTFAYDSLGRRTKLTDPLGNSTAFAYSQGQASGVTYPLGSATFTTDLNGRVTKRAYSDGTTINTTYNALGQVVSADGVSITRNNMGQATNVNGIAVTYDPAGRPATITYNAGKALTYTFDSIGRVSSITDWVGGKTTFAYDAANRLATLTYPNGIATTYTYDPDSHVIGIAAGKLSSITLTRDAAGKVISAVRNLPIAPNLVPGSQQNTYDAAAQLTTANYDKMGRVNTQNARTYKWNLASELTSFSDPIDAPVFTYDGLGQMISKTSGTIAQSYVYNYALPLPALSIVRQGSADLRYYVYTLSGKLLYSVDASSNARKFYHFDEIGNTVFLTDDSGTITDSYGISPYGEIADHVGTTDNPFTWQGQTGAMQEGSALYYMRARHYDATTARFISRDPVISTDPRAIEPYSYAGGNPLTYKDPMGSCFLWVFFCSPPADPPAPPADPPPPPDPPLAPPPLEPDPVYLDPLPVQTQPVDAGPTCSKVGSCGTQLSGSPGGDSSSLNGPLVGTLVNNPLYLVMCSGQLYQGLSCLSAFPSNLVYDVPGTGLIGHDGASIAGPGASVYLIGHDGASLIGHDGASVVSNDGGSLIGHDGASLINFGTDGLINWISPLINQDGAGLINQDGAGLINQDGAGLFGNAVGSLLSRLP